MTHISSDAKLQQIAIIGAGGCGRDLLVIVDAINDVKLTFNMLGFVVDSQYGQPGTLVNDKPILGDFSWIEQNPGVHLICGVGSPRDRRKLVIRAQEYGATFCTLIHPHAVIPPRIEVGHGTAIAAGSIFTNRIRIGNHVHINLATTISHDCILEDFVTVSPGVHCSGNVTLNEGCFIGMGTNIIEKLNVGHWSTVGAGSTIIMDVPNNATVLGVPGKVQKTKKTGWYLD